MTILLNSAMVITSVVLALAVAVALALAWQTMAIYVRRRWSKRIRLGPLLAYASQQSVRLGATIEVCVHSTQRVAASLFRLGAELSTTDWEASVDPTIQSNRYDFWRGCGWSPNLAIDTSSLDPGMYVLHLEHRDNPAVTFRLPLIISPRTPVDVAVVASTNTWQAYNPFAGLSNYRYQAFPFPLRIIHSLLSALNVGVVAGDCKCIPSVPLAFSRPNLLANDDLADLEASPIEHFSHWTRAEWALLKHLDREHVSYGVYSDYDLAFNAQVTQAKLLIFNVHSEYWSEEMIGRLTAYLAKGGKAAFFSGNNLYRRVQFHQHGLTVYDFRADRGPVAALTGTAYDARGFETYAGYRVEMPEHWVFAGLGVNEGDVFGEREFGFDGCRLGASGYETDKVTAESGALEVLAIGCNLEGPAYMVCKPTSRGGWIFNTSSVASAAWVDEDAVLAGILRNLVRQALDHVEERPTIAMTA